MKINRTILVRLLWIFAGVSLLLLCYDLIRFFGLGEEAGVGVFGLAATLVGTIFIAIELRNSQVVTCCEMLIDQINYFHDNEHIMEVYKALERSQLEGDVRRFGKASKMWTSPATARSSRICTCSTATRSP